MPHGNRRRRTRQIEVLRAPFAQGDGLAFAEVLPAERVERALAEEGANWREIAFTPLLTLWAFLGQVINADASCRAAVARVLAWLASRGQKPCRPQTGPYCKARKRLPESLFTRLVRETGSALHRELPGEWLWKGRRVKLVDGSTASMPDTEENQAEYPQARTQKPGIGLPIARMVVVFCLASGAVLDAALGKYRGKQTGENSLVRTLEDAFTPGDVFLADRYFSGYFDVASWRQRGVDVVVRLHQLRDCDRRRGRRLGPNDHVIVWTKPSQRPAWMDKRTYAAMPATLELREVRVMATEPGFRSKVVVVVTTLLDARVYRAEDLADWYRMRWHAELDLRSWKIVLGMDVLRCHSPEMIRKEFWAHLLAYNLIRTVMAQAAEVNGCTPRELSFKGTLQTMTAFAERLLDANPATAADLYQWLLLAIGAHQVGDRPGRSEPRKRKRRPKHYPPLNTPRNVARN
jgi:Transposase DDE domain